MDAIVYHGVKDVGVEKVPDPRIEREDDIIVKVTSTAICGSDLHLIHGRVPALNPGFILGHETMGIVAETGKAVTNVKKGDRVIVPFPVACGHCFFCEHGEYSHATTLIQTEEPAACSGTVTPSADIREDRHSICGFLTPM